MVEIGATLRTAREQRGFSIDDAAEATKIRASYLVALEKEDFECLPGPTYARGFLRSYSEFLELDAQQLIDEFSERFSSAPWEVDDEVMFPRRGSSRSSRHSSHWSGIVIVVIVGILAITVLIVIAATYPSTRTTPLPATGGTNVVTVTEAAVNPVATVITAQTTPDSTSAAAEAIVFVKPFAQVTLTVRALESPEGSAALFQQKVDPNPNQPNGFQLPKSASGYLIRLDRPNTLTLVVNGSPVVPGPTDTLLSIDPNGRVAAITE